MSKIDRHVISEEVSMAYDEIRFLERCIHEYVTPDDGEHFPYTRIIHQTVDIETDEVYKEEIYYQYEPVPEYYKTMGNEFGVLRSGKTVSHKGKLVIGVA